ncbi:MAG TPA: hypothetical protein VM942_05200, partial [Acidimicrobiales bacterium]|nr:hypothetical protein [Acidimicrobiales bacterium]
MTDVPAPGSTPPPTGPPDPGLATAALAAVSEAVLGVAGDLSVLTVLQRLAAAAQQLVDAR